MFVARRIIRRNKLFTKFISTSDVVSGEKPKDENEAENSVLLKQKKNEKRKVSLSSKSLIDTILEFPIESSLTKSKQTSRQNAKTFKKAMVKSVNKVAEELGGNVKKTTDEILSYLKNFDISKDLSKADEFPMQHLQVRVSVDPNKRFFTRFQPLNIFSEEIKNKEPEIKLNIWDDLEAEELKYLTKTAPNNWFEEMIVLTEEKKLWQFPIDNDQGMEKEADISFTEHIFMEHYLEPWCPKKGPLRKFMEMVLIGLSKNHYYTIEEKKAHIYWFRDYFEEKRKLLQQVGALGPAKEPKAIEFSTKEENT